MNIIIVIPSNVLGFPPIISLINILNRMQIKTILICTKTSFDVGHLKYVTEKIINIDYEQINNPLKKITLLGSLGKKIWDVIDESYDENTVIWAVSNLSLKYLGNRIKKYRYVLHLLELSEELRYYDKISFIKLNKTEIGNKALAVVVPEYNRAHIIQAWWDLINTPFIFSNKPYMNDIIQKNTEISDSNAARLINQIGNKKIVLYQGIISPERPLDKFIKAVDLLGDEYAFVVMSGGKNIYANSTSKNYYFIPFVKPPKHLEITSRAYIGVLSYFPTHSTGYSILNSLYCAPNKTFEFGLFGIPMIGNDIPGLRYLFETQHNGLCIEKFTEKEICKAIKTIENNYDAFASSSAQYFANINSELEIRKIIDYIEKK